MRLSKHSLLLKVGLVVILAAGASTTVFSASKSNSAPEKKPAPASPAQKNSNLPKGILTGSELEVSIPQPRYIGASNYAAATQSILIATGGAETDGNSAWKRHITLDPNGTVHIAYKIFKGVTGQNNLYSYNTYNCLGFTGSLKYSDGGEPSLGMTLSSGGGRIQPNTSAGLVYGRQGVSLDTAQCDGSFNSNAFPSQPPDVGLHAANESTWVITMGNSNDLREVLNMRTTDAGATWTTPVPTTRSSFVNTSEIVGKGNMLYIASIRTDYPDSGAFIDIIHPVYVKSTDDGATWSSIRDATDEYWSEWGDYIPVGIAASALLIEDTLHVFWLDWDSNGNNFPGGHVYHAAVFPDGSKSGLHKVADININGAEPDRSSTNFGLGNGIWAHISSSYRPTPLPTLYVLWSAPPDNGAGGFADSTDPATAGGRYFGCQDIFLASSRNHGRSWDIPRNITQTNAPGCNGTTVPCYSEDLFQVAEVADTLLYVLAKVDKFPGFQSLGDPGPDTRLSDEWRLLLVPSRTDPCDFCCSAAKGDLNNDGFLNPTDVVLELNCVFLSDVPSLGCNCDLNCDNLATPSDVVLELNAVFLGISLPPCP